MFLRYALIMNTLMNKIFLYLYIPIIMFGRLPVITVKKPSNHFLKLQILFTLIFDYAYFILNSCHYLCFVNFYLQ